MMKRLHFIFLCVMAAGFSLLTSCSSLKSSNKLTLRFAQDGWVHSTEGAPLFVKKGDQMALEPKPILVESSGHVSVLVVPTEAPGTIADVKLVPESSVGAQSQYHLNVALSQLIPKVNEIQLLLGKRKEEKALVSVNDLMQNYPALTYLRFLRASCLTLMERKDEAKMDLELALQSFPNHRDGKRLYKHITGVDWESPTREVSSEKPKNESSGGQ